MAHTPHSCHQTGFIISKLDNGAYVNTLTSHGVEFTAEELPEFFCFFNMHAPLSPQEIDHAIARDGQSVVGSPTRLNAEEQALCVC